MTMTMMMISMIFSKPTVTKTQHGTAMALRNGLGEKKKKRGVLRA
jgi:hypothetical protein